MLSMSQAEQAVATPTQTELKIPRTRRAAKSQAEWDETIEQFKRSGLSQAQFVEGRPDVGLPALRNQLAIRSKQARSAKAVTTAVAQSVAAKATEGAPLRKKAAKKVKQGISAPVTPETLKNVTLDLKPGVFSDAFRASGNDYLTAPGRERPAEETTVTIRAGEKLIATISHTDPRRCAELVMFTLSGS